MSKYKPWKSFEREIARDLQDIDPTARRNIEECREGSHDILNSMGFAIQCKHGKAPSPWNALTQAKYAKQGTPLAVIRKDNYGTVVTLFWKDFLEMLKYADNGGFRQKKQKGTPNGDTKRKLAMQKDSFKYKEDSERLSSDLAGASD